jgi:tetratricopeptide (TPR) repeat protein
LHGIVAVAAERLGKKAFKEFVPHFWGVLDTRPYMRARFQLAEELREAGQVEDAIEEYEEMLLLNENDNLGVRYHLLPCLFALGRLDEARKLLKRYPGECEWNVVFAWSRVLERLVLGDEPGASKALDRRAQAPAHGGLSERASQAAPEPARQLFRRKQGRSTVLRRVAADGVDAAP